MNQGPLNRGIILILIIVSLSLVVAIALALLTFVKVGTEVARLEIVNTRSRFIAESGINYALSNLILFAKRRYIPNVMENFTYFGEDANANTILDPGEDTNANGFLDTISCDIENANFPSYAHSLAIINDKKPVKFVSGSLPSLFTTLKGDVFILKIVDTSSKIYIQDKNPQIPLIIKNLAEYLSLEISTEEMEEIEKLRKQEIYSQSEFQREFFNTKFKRIFSYLTFFGVPDEKVIQPKPYDKRSKKLSINQPVFSWLDYIPYKVSLASRTPISINTAPIEVVAANLIGIAGTYIDQNDKKSAIDFSKLNQIPFVNFLFNLPILNFKPYIGVLKEVKIDKEKGILIAEEIRKRKMAILSGIKTGQIPNRPIFYNWEDFENFLNELTSKNIINAYEKDLILANVNPNTNFNKFNPTKFYHVDKTDLTSYTTEFTLGISGIFEVESLGYVLKKSKDMDEIVAKHTAKQVLKIFDILKDTTQEDFEMGKILTRNYNGKKLPLAEIYPFSADFKDKVGKYVDGYLSLARTFISSKNVINSANKNEYILFVDGYYATFGSNLCIPVPQEIFNKKKWKFTISFWLKPAFSFENEVNPKIFTSLVKGELAKLEITYFSLTFFPNKFGIGGFATSPFLLLGFNTMNILDTIKLWRGTKKTTIIPHQWYLISIVIDSEAKNPKDIAKIYINAEDVTAALSGNFENITADNTLKFDENDYFCFGPPKGLKIWDFPPESTFDDIALFPTALPSKDIKRIFKKGRFIKADEFVFASKYIELKNQTIGIISWDDNATTEIAFSKDRVTYYSLISLQLLDRNNKVLVDEVYNPISSPVGNVYDTTFYYKIKYNIPEEFTKENILMESPILNEVTITLIPKFLKDMILTKFYTYEK